MSDTEREEQAREAAGDPSAPPGDDGHVDDDDVPSPFDHPAFMPVILFGAALYFGYDGWITQNPELLDDRTFNRVGFAVLLAAAIYFTIRGLRGSRGDER